MNWTAVGVITAIAAALLSLVSAGAGDYRRVGDRVTTLETQRVEDQKRFDQQRSDDSRWRERMEQKVDLLLQRR